MNETLRLVLLISVLSTLLPWTLGCGDTSRQSTAPAVSPASAVAASGANSRAGTCAVDSEAMQFSLSQTSFSFPATTIGSMSGTTDVITLKSTGTAALSISKITNSDLTD